MQTSYVTRAGCYYIQATRVSAILVELKLVSKDNDQSHTVVFEDTMLITDLAEFAKGLTDLDKVFNKKKTRRKKK